MAAKRQCAAVLGGPGVGRWSKHGGCQGGPRRHCCGSLGGGRGRPPARRLGRPHRLGQFLVREVVVAAAAVHEHDQRPRLARRVRSVRVVAHAGIEHAVAVDTRLSRGAALPRLAAELSSDRPQAPRPRVGHAGEHRPPRPPPSTPAPARPGWGQTGRRARRGSWAVPRSSSTTPSRPGSRNFCRSEVPSTGRPPNVYPGMRRLSA